MIKSKILVLLVCFIYTPLLCNCTLAQTDKYLPIETCPFQINIPKAITKSDDGFNHPRISPDGKNIIVTKQRYTGVYLINTDNPRTIRTINTEIKSGYSTSWNSDSKAITYYSFTNENKKTSKKRMLYNAEDKTTKPIHTAYTFDKSNNLSIRYNTETSMVEATDGTKKWNITHEPGMYYGLLLSPNKENAIIHKNDGKFYIYDIYGQSTPIPIDYGICESWSENGDYVIYFIDKDDGHKTVASDLFIASTDGTMKWQLTETSDRIEKWPTWSTSAGKLTYFDEKDGQIYLINFRTITQ